MTHSSIFLLAAGIVSAVAALTTFGAATACNTGNTDCPDKAMVVAGASCSDNHLQCAYDLSTPPAECDGTMTVIETSCTCTNGQWNCPSAFECDGGASGGEDAGQEAGDDAASTDAGGDEASLDAGGDSGDAHD